MLRNKHISIMYNKQTTCKFIVGKILIMSILLFYIREFDHWLKPNDKIKKLYDSFKIYV